MANDSLKTSAKNILPITNEDTVGPYFPMHFYDCGLDDISQIHSGLTVRPEGRSISISGRVLDRFGKLANGIMMEFWQANAKGIYRTPDTISHEELDPWFNGYGRLRSPSGAYNYKTIMPGAAPGRAPNVTITLFSDGICRVVTQMFFAGVKANESDPLLISLDQDETKRLIARHVGVNDDDVDCYEFDIVMAGENETPFFDDFES